MTVEDITNRLTPYYSWLSSVWLPVLIAIAVLFIVIIVLILRSRRKVLPTKAQLRDIIDIELADHNKTSDRTDPVKKDHSANAPKKRERRKRRKNTKKGFKMAIVQLNQRREEIIKSRQAELRLRQETAAMATVNEQIQNEVEVTDSSQAGQPREQKVYEIVPDNEPFKLKVIDSRQVGQHPIQKASEIVVFNEPFQLKKSEQQQPEKVPEESSEQDPKSKKQSQQFDIAEFSKAAISRRQRQVYGIYNEYSDLDED